MRVEEEATAARVREVSETGEGRRGDKRADKNEETSVLFYSVETMTFRKPVSPTPGLGSTWVGVFNSIISVGLLKPIGTGFL